MIRKIEKNEIIRGKVEAVNEKGLKLNSRWYNFSKFLPEKPQISENTEVEFIASGDFITKFLNIQKPPAFTDPDADELLLNALRSAVKIASILESEVSIKFSTQDIIKLALTLFIQKSN